MPLPSILITGATGRIGSELINLLSQARAPVRVLVRDQSKVKHRNSAIIENRIGDLLDKPTLIQALKNIDKVFLVSSDHPDQERMETNLIEAAMESKVRHIVKVSVFVAGLNPPISFGIHHASIEQKLRNSGLAWTILRPYMFMQNFLSFANLIVSKHVFMGPFGKSNISMIDARDVAAVAMRVLVENGHEEKTYELTGPEPINFKQAAAILTNVLGKRIRFISVPSFIAGFAMRQEGVSKWEVSMRLQLFKFLKAGGEAQTTDVVHRIGKISPRGFNDFARDYAAHFQARNSG